MSIIRRICAIAALLSMGLVWQHGESAEKHARNLKAHTRLLLRREELIFVYYEILSEIPVIASVSATQMQ